MYESGRGKFTLSSYIFDKFKEALHPTMSDIDIAPRLLIWLLRERRGMRAQ